MIYLLIIAGMFLGALTAGVSGFILGGVTGYLLWLSTNLKTRIYELEKSLKLLKHAAPPQTPISKYKPVDNISRSPVTPTPPSAQESIQEPTQSKLDQQPISTTTKPPADFDKPSPAAVAKSITAKNVAKPSATSGWDSNRDFVPEEIPIVRWVKNYFTAGNTLVRVGVVILFIGVAFLVKYAAERGIVPIELRMTGVALGGLILIIIGWRVRVKNAAYALAVQGGGVGILYLTIFAAMRLYQLIPPTFAFGLLLLMCILSSALAVLQNSRALAILGFSGGFLAPVLTSTGGGSHVMLFSYYALLNAGILGIAWYKSWRLLNLIGFGFTFVIGTAWGAMRFNPELLASTEPFLILFFLYYVAISVLYALRQPINLRGYVDGTLVFGTPIVVFSLQFGLVHHLEYGLAYSAMALCVFYILLAYSIFKFVAKYNTDDGIKLICESFLSIGVVFGTVAIPLSLDDQWTSAAWCLEGCALIYIAIRQHRTLAYFSGFVLQVGAAWFVFQQLEQSQHWEHWVLLNGAYVSALLVCIAGILSGYLVYRHKEKIKHYTQHTETVLLVWGFLWWLLSGMNEIMNHGDKYVSLTWFLLFGSLTAFLSHGLGRKIQWPLLKKCDRTLGIFLIFALIISAVELQHPFMKGIGLAWLISLFTYYLVLKQNDDKPLLPILQWQHGVGIWLITILLSWEIVWWIDSIMPSMTFWALSICLLIPGLILTGMLKADGFLNWPFRQHKDVYIKFVSTPISAYLYLASVVFIISQDGNAYPLKYLPIINPMDITVSFSIVCILFWLQMLKQTNFGIKVIQYSTEIYSVIAVMVFLFITSALLRTIHHWYGVPYTLAGIIESNLAQTALTLLWAILAVAIMVHSSKKLWRTGWLAGAGLIGIVIAKLFMMDLASIGTIERIISFIGVGVLMLAVGYFAPLPQKQFADKNENNKEDTSVAL